MKRSNLTPSQAAELLHVAPSTLRLWSQLFADSLSAEAQSDGRKHRTYSPDDIATLQRAGELLRTHKPDEVKALLPIGNDMQRGAALAILPSIANEINTLRSQMAADRAEIERLRSEVAALFERQRKKQAAQQAEIDDLRARVDDLTARRSWWQRLRRG